MRFLWRNLADDGALSTNSEISTLPVANVQTPQLAERFYAAAGVTGVYIQVDLGSSLAVDLVAVLATTLTSASTWRIRASDIDYTTGDLYDSGTVATGISASSYPTAQAVLPSTVTARYWRVFVSDTSVDQIQIGRLVMGPAYQPSRGPRLGYSIGWVDAAGRGVSRGGQIYVDPRYLRRRVTVQVRGVTEIEAIDSLLELGRVAGTRSDVYAVLQESGSHVLEYSLWGLLDDGLVVTEEEYAVYSARLAITERL